MNLILTIIATFGIALAEAIQPLSIVKSEWELYKTTYNKSYDNLVEERYRMKIFLKNKMKVLEHNLHFERNQTSYKMEVNHLSDMLPSELEYMHGLEIEPEEDPKFTQASFFVPPAHKLVYPESIDWRTKGVVTPAKNQGPCGSCWAFSTTGAMEGQRARRTKKLVSLSEQDLIDCCKNNYGCRGGSVTIAYDCIKRYQGIDRERDYPYEAKEGMCRFNRSQAVADAIGHRLLPKGDEEILKIAVTIVGPISAGIHASHSLHHYKSGVYYHKDCHKRMNHGVLVVGYGRENGMDYWLIKNSWGGKWGEEGYFKIARNTKNYCHVASAASYPLL